MLTEEHHRLYADLMGKGKTWQEAATEVATQFRLRAPVAQLIFPLEVERLRRAGVSLSPAPPDPATVEFESEAPVPEAEDTGEFDDLLDQAMEQAAELEIEPATKSRILRDLARIGARVGREAVEVLTREVLRHIADFRLRDPARLRARAARQEQRGNTARAEQLRALASSIESGR